MNFLGHASFAENPNAQEGRFHKESEQSFYGKWSPKDIAYVAAVFAPVHAELEFLHDTCHHANGEVDQEQFSPELGHFAPGFVFGLVVASLHECYKQPHA